MTPNTRTSIVACVACVLLANGCVVELATIELKVRESADEARRRSKDGNALQVTYVLDELSPDGVETGVQDIDGFSFRSDAATTDSQPQRLKPNPQRLTMALAVGGGAGFPLESAFAVGRVDPLLLPALDTASELTFEARAFLAQPDAFELVDAFVPAPGPQAVCDNRAGFVAAAGTAAAYRMEANALALKINEAGFNTDGDQIIACDIQDVVERGVVQPVEGSLVVAHGSCVGNLAGTHDVIINVGDEENLIEKKDQAGELCDPFVRVVTVDDGAVVWVATRTFAALYNLADGELLGRQDFAPFFLSGTVRHVLLDNGTLIASADGVDAETGDTNGVIIRRISDAALQPAEPTVGLNKMIAGDPSGPAALFENGDADDGVFTLGLPSVDEDDNVVSGDGTGKEVVFDEGFVPTRILVLNGDDDDRDNDVVVGMNDEGDVQIDGGKKHTERRHNRFAIGFGRAIILAGNLVGHDVLVRPFDDAEIDLLESRTPN